MNKRFKPKAGFVNQIFSYHYTEKYKHCLELGIYIYRYEKE